MKKFIQTTLCTISFLTLLFLNISAAFASSCTLNGGCPGACNSVTSSSACNTTCCTQNYDGREINYRCVWVDTTNSTKCTQSDIMFTN